MDGVRVWSEGIPGIVLKAQWWLALLEQDCIHSSFCWRIVARSSVDLASSRLTASCIIHFYSIVFAQSQCSCSVPFQFPSLCIDLSFHRLTVHMQIPFCSATPQSTESIAFSTPKGLLCFISAIMLVHMSCRRWIARAFYAGARMVA